MSTQPTSREELYKRIRESSRDEVILIEMIRLGFWPKAGELPHDPADEIRRRAELEAELRALRTEQARLQDIDRMKREARKRRMAESRERRKETKERKLRERAERAEQWAQAKTKTLLYLGPEVSAGLNDHTADAAKLKARDLPTFETPADLAQAMGCTLGKLRFLTFTRAASKVSHYIQFTLPKRSGGRRLISAPLPRLKDAQHWVLHNLLSRVPLHEAAHGFVPGRSIVSNATPHVHRAVVVNLDLKDFFPTVSYRRVKGLFHSLGYSESVATVLALLCTEPRSVPVQLDGDTYHVALEERVLPQGAPTSPAITNLLCRSLDNRLTRISKQLGFTYTRYADDLSFSGDADANVGLLLRRVRFVVGQEGFVVHPDKTRVFRKGRRQEVTGLVVNEQLSLTRAQLKRFRATLFQLEKDGPEGKHWGEGDDVIAAVEGFANYVAMVNQETGAPLQERTRALVERYGKKPQARPTHRPSTLSEPWHDSSHAATARAQVATAPELVTPAAPNTQTVGSDPSGPPSTDPVMPSKKPWWKLW